MSMKTWFDRIQEKTPTWLAKRRQEGWELYQRLPMPQRNEEDWRRTDLRGLHLEDFSPTWLTPTDEIPPWYPRGEAYMATQLEHDSEASCEHGEVPQGVIFTDLETAAREHRELVEPYLFQQVPLDFNRFVALHAALWQGGTFLYVPPGVHLEMPLHTLVTLQTAGRMGCSHTLVVVGEGASATLAREWRSRSSDAPGFHSGVSEIFLKDGATLTYYDVQQWNRRTWDFNVQRVRLAREAHLNWITGVTGGRVSKSYREVYLDGTGSEALMSGVFLARERQHLDIQTYQAHEAERTHSNLLYKGVLADKARTVFRGMIRVAPEGQRTDAYQTNRNLLLSPDARADSIPGLEIEADDVRCSHSAAASPIDPEQKFYLMSRGIPESVARTMLVYGFVDDVLQKVQLEEIRSQLEDAILQLL